MDILKDVTPRLAPTSAVPSVPFNETPTAGADASKCPASIPKQTINWQDNC